MTLEKRLPQGIYTGSPSQPSQTTAILHAEAFRLARETDLEQERAYRAIQQLKQSPEYEEARKRLLEHYYH